MICTMSVDQYQMWAYTVENLQTVHENITNPLEREHVKEALKEWQSQSDEIGYLFC